MLDEWGPNTFLLICSLVGLLLGVYSNKIIFCLSGMLALLLAYMMSSRRVKDD